MTKPKTRDHEAGLLAAIKPQARNCWTPGDDAAEAMRTALRVRDSGKHLTIAQLVKYLREKCDQPDATESKINTWMARELGRTLTGRSA
jgi:hypothetical protein